MKFLSLVTLLCFAPLVTFAQDQSVDQKITDEAIESRIDQLRKGEIIVRTDPGVEVRVEQKRHEFLFGTAIPNSLAEGSEEPMSDRQREKFLQIIADNFNYAVHENALKWYSNEKQQGVVDYSVSDRIFELMSSLGIRMRGHTIFWAKDEFLMDWLKALDNDSLRKAVVDRAISVTEHYKGKIDEFDLNNEMIHGDFFRRRLGYGVINEMAWLVKSANPNAKLYMNDYGIVDVGYNAGPYAKQIEKLLENGVPIDGIGIQAHRSISGEVNNTRYMVQRNLDRFNKFNLPIKITEALFVYDNDETRAEELKKLFPVYFAHPNVEAIVMWGVWAGDHWIPHSAMWGEEFQPSLQSEAYRDLVYGKWWTDVTAIADRSGEVKTKAFYGGYLITVNGQQKHVYLKKEDGRLVVEM